MFSVSKSGTGGSLARNCLLQKSIKIDLFGKIPKKPITAGKLQSFHSIYFLYTFIPIHSSNLPDKYFDILYPEIVKDIFSPDQNQRLL